ncbi:acyclic terpene utilization AtuA family protein [Mycobacterium leprae]|uniref:Acyclic terpene utilization AtuA family protein n=2 Tax=Mycobacterium leprae TaxID=1769 RepID=Q9Z5G9_MYCLR|nr:acyclic terpene utilization AtuA family protein [Mycobacterium leprae]AWV47164.1 acyclic terpene utilization AtuA family protein [Mycobacterium leprae]CAB36686.1 hypothetical protein MLCB373.24c [Mycobacterium leprae]
MVSHTVRISNCPAFYGNRLSVMRKILTYGELNFVTGDYLAEVTTMLLGSDRRNTPTGARRQDLPEFNLKTALKFTRDRKCIVVNTGRLNSAGLEDAVQALAELLGIGARIVRVEGDHLGQSEPEVHRDRNGARTAAKGVELVNRTRDPAQYLTTAGTRWRSAT